MRAHHLLAFAAAAAAATACGGDAPAPTAPAAAAPAPSLAVLSLPAPPAAPLGCPVVRSYYLDEITPYAIAQTAIVNGALGPATSFVTASMDYERAVDAAMFADLQASSLAGCTANIQFRSSHTTSTLGVATSEYEGHVRAGAQRAGTATWGTLGRVDPAWAQPPAPAGCVSFICPTSLHHVIEIGPGIQANLAVGDLLRVEMFAAARADAVGVSVVDQAMASFGLDRGSGLNPYGPRLVVYLP